MRGRADRQPPPPEGHHDALGVRIQQWDRVLYCRCGKGGMTVAWVVQLDPLIVFDPDARQHTQIFQSRHLVVVDESDTERQVRNALCGVGLTQLM